MIDPSLEFNLVTAFMAARNERQQSVTVEHLLRTLLNNATVVEILRACGANVEVLRERLSVFISENAVIVPGNKEVASAPTLGFERTIQRAFMYAQKTDGKQEVVTGARVLIAIFGEKDSHATYLLHQQGLTRLDVHNYMSYGIKKG